MAAILPGAVCDEMTAGIAHHTRICRYITSPGEEKTVQWVNFEQSVYDFRRFPCIFHALVVK